jgi:hypothetical protein
VSQGKAEMFFIPATVIAVNNRYRWEHTFGYKDVKAPEASSLRGFDYIMPLFFFVYLFFHLVKPDVSTWRSLRGNAAFYSFS